MGQTPQSLSCPSQRDEKRGSENMNVPRTNFLDRLDSGGEFGGKTRHLSPICHI